MFGGGIALIRLHSAARKIKLSFLWGELFRRTKNSTALYDIEIIKLEFE